MTDLAFYQNRLAKNARHLRKWAARNGIHAYRLYDRDIPEFPVIADWYEAESGPRVHLQEVETGWQQTPAEHDEWIDHVAAATAETLGIEPDRIALKVRARQRVKGEKSDQYVPTGKRGEELIVHEGPLRFLIDLESYLDTGLFLDHRNTRAMVGARAAGKRFLNLFCYTGSFSVHAAHGGAVATDSVDLSNTYLDWAHRNFDLNALPCGEGTPHRLIRADVFAWLRTAAGEAGEAGEVGEVGEGRQYDLIVLDPPTFSNSKKMLGVLDVQRDHPWLIRQCLALLAPGGELFFSTNLRSFKLDEQVQTRARFTEITARTIPEDFRDRKIHRAWLIAK